ncbi:MAG: helix-turn-helix domain-containing protein [Aquisalinus sp.]|nr:helix-turn-helix domain-containing protein [Aquisalinus sp.]
MPNVRMTAIDALIGLRIRDARNDAGITQKDLAAEMGISYQQLQKYETGMDRIVASRLMTVAKYTDKNLYYFFDAPMPAEILAEMSQDRIEECYDLFDAMLDVLPRKVKAALTVIILQFLHYEDQRQKLAA